MELLTEREIREIAAEPMSARERRIACTALDWFDRAERAESERDDAQARLRELEAMTSIATILAVHKALGAAPGESVVTRAEVVMERLAEARREQNRSMVRQILGVLSDVDESLVQQAERVVAERDSARRKRDSALARVVELEAEAAGIAYFACWPDGVLKAMGFTDVSSVAEVIERVNALVGAERERDRLLRSEADVCAILGAATGELLSDAARRHARTEALVTEARKYLEPLVSDPSGDIEDLAMMVAHRIADLRQILRARDGESLKDAARRAAVGAEPPQVFRIIPRVTVDRHGVRFEVVTTDPGIRALTAGQLSRLGLVVCDE